MKDACTISDEGCRGRIQDFKLGGVHLKKLCQAEGGAKNFGVFRVKNHDFTPKNHIFSNFRGGAPPGSAPGMHVQYQMKCWHFLLPHALSLHCLAVGNLNMSS